MWAAELRFLQDDVRADRELTAGPEQLANLVQRGTDDLHRVLRHRRDESTSCRGCAQLTRSPSRKPKPSLGSGD
jgi:hypothetical protein